MKRTPNPFFHFKQFSIYQDHCAMKVTTDACLFGGWMVQKIKELKIDEGDALDVGTGTGLLSLMLAQELTLNFDSIEINAEASLQAKENVEASKWSDRINVFNQPLQQFVPTKKYQIIFSNPPFFENDLKSPDSQRNSAMHDATLKIEEILFFAQEHLSVNGHLFLMIPSARLTELMNVFNAHSFNIKEVISVKQTEKHPYFRNFIHLVTDLHSPTIYAELVIKSLEGQYTALFINMMKGFYL